MNLKLKKLGLTSARFEQSVKFVILKMVGTGCQLQATKIQFF